MNLMQISPYKPKAPIKSEMDMMGHHRIFSSHIGGICIMRRMTPDLEKTKAKKTEGKKSEINVWLLRASIVQENKKKIEKEVNMRI